MRAAFQLLCLFGASALAHIEMTSPYPFQSKSNPDNTAGEIDYTMKNPLLSDGSNFPCKGHHEGGAKPTAKYEAGNTYTVELDGTATHGGGSCQLSLSYDQGKTFKVIKSIMGGCPLDMSYDFEVPKSAPSGDAIFAWSWFNLVGNREMYMNCVPVSVENSGDGDISSLPDLWIANVGNGCETVEGQETVFENPGENVVYGGTVTPSSPAFPKC